MSKTDWLNREQYVVDEASGCWVWQRSTISGYGCLGYKGAVRLAHRVYYLELVGEIPEGHDLHHRCETRRCVNPAHLEPILHSDHVRLHRTAEVAPKRCEQCGRVGTRDFKTYGGFTDERWGYIEPITVCGATKACRRRWPKREVVDA